MNLTPSGKPTPTQVVAARLAVAAVNAESHPANKRPKSGAALSVLGVLIFIATLVLDGYQVDIHLWLFSGVAFLFLIFGYYVRDKSAALKFGAFAVNSVGGILAVIRTGRRKDDPVVVIPITDTPSQEFIAPKPKIIPKGPPKADEG